MVVSNRFENVDGLDIFDFGPDGIIEDDSPSVLKKETVSMEDIKDEEDDDDDVRPERSKDKKTRKKKDLPPFWEKVKAWCKKHLHLLVALLVILLAVIIYFIVDCNLNKVTLNTTTSGLAITYDVNKKGEKVTSDLPVRVLAYNADMGSSPELLYYVDTIAKANPTDGTLKISWDVPREHAYKRGTYNEFCILDDGAVNDTINGYCGGKNGNTNPANVTDTTAKEKEHTNVKFNNISCAYHVPPHTNGIIAFLSGWNKLNEKQQVGCATEGKDWGSSSYLDRMYGFSSGNFAYVNEKAGNNGANSGSNMDKNDDSASLSGLTMENFFQSLLSAHNSSIDAGDIIKNSFSNNFIYNDEKQVMDLTKTGVPAGQSCDSTSTNVIERPAPKNGSDNSTTQVWRCIPVFTVDQWGRLTGLSSTSIEYDPITGNEVVGVTGSYSGLVRSGEGTFLDPYTLAVALNSDGNGGLKIDSNGKLAVVAPECTAVQTPQIIDPSSRNQTPGNDVDTSLNKLQWTYDGENGKFTCAHDIDNQQLDMAQDSDSTIGLSEVETYTVSLSGDEASSIQFIDRDTRYIDGAGIALNLVNGANIFSADVGNGEILLCPDGGTSCSETEKTIQVNIGGDNNTGHIGTVNSGGLEFGTGGKLQISSPTCGEDTQVLTWDGSKFECISGTDWNIAAEGTSGNYNVGDNDLIEFMNGTNGGGLTATREDTIGGTSIKYELNDTGVTSGQYAPSIANTTAGTTTSRSISIPTFTVNSAGQLTQANTQAIMAVSADSTKGITIDSNGDLSIAGLNSTGTNCVAGSGLTWNGLTFSCTTPYSWNLSANGATSVRISHDATVNFNAIANGGLTVNRAGNSIAYGLSGFDISSCTGTNNTLKVNTSGNIYCTPDNNTTYALSKSGSTISLTGSDGTVTSVADSDSIKDVGVTVEDKAYFYTVDGGWIFNATYGSWCHTIDGVTPQTLSVDLHGSSNIQHYYLASRNMICALPSKGDPALIAHSTDCDVVDCPAVYLSKVE